LGNAQMLEV